MTAPERIRLSRRKGYRKPAGAVVVTRPSRWGNPYRVVPATHGWDVLGPDDNTLVELADREAAADCAVTWYRQALLGGRLPFTVADVRRELAGKALACWCPEDARCHADVLLSVANTKRAGAS